MTRGGKARILTGAPSVSVAIRIIMTAWLDCGRLTFAFLATHVPMTRNATMRMAFTGLDQFEVLCGRKCGHLLQKGHQVPDGLILDTTL